MTTIILTGLPLSGKTTLGYTLAKHLNYKFIDTDKTIETLYNTSIANLIAKFGIKNFRVIEHHTIKNLLQSNVKNTVIALGGGSFNNLTTQKLCKQKGTVVWLNVNINIITKYLLTKKQQKLRPLLQNNSLTSLLQKRKIHYSKSHVVVSYNALVSKQKALNILLNALHFNRFSTIINIKSQKPSQAIINNFVFSHNLANYFKLNAYNKIIIIADNKLSKLHLQQVYNQLQFYNINFNVINITVTEKAKNLNNATKLINKILQHNINKQTAILAIGGGVIGDLCGMCASIILRGLPLFYMPTTLLAMVDSSIGGKNGVNTQYGKNLVGSIYSANAIFIDYIWLQTLPKQQVESGYFEGYKYGVLFSKQFLQNIIQQKLQLLNLNPQTIHYMVSNSIQFKANIIKQDEFEKHNIRYLLNLGHTLGHALETYTNYKTIPHGHAVAIGIYFIAKLCNNINMLSLSSCNYICNNLNFGSLQKNLPANINISQLITIMLKDKKNLHNHINLVLIKDIENCVFTKNINIQLITTTLNNLLKK